MAKADKKSGGQKSALVGMVSTTAAVFVVRKAITAAWTRATGKVPPTDPSDPKVGIMEALGWAVIAGASIEAARLFATRAATRGARKARESEEL